MNAVVFAFLLVAVSAVRAFDANCHGLSVCVAEGATNCNLNSRQCAQGSYCNFDPTSPGPRSPVGTCLASSAVEGTCNTGAQPAFVDCYDPSYTGIDCIASPAPARTVSTAGTCKYLQIYAPGETCNLNSNASYVAGGCISGSCDPTTSKCTTVTAGNSCAGGHSGLCSPGLYCDTNTSLCSPRLTSGSYCTRNSDCDYTLVCSSLGGTYDQSSCVTPFQQTKANPCDSDLDCVAGLLCDNETNVCEEPSAFHGEDCPTGDCQFGWGCECAVSINGNIAEERGGKCRLSQANEQSYINNFLAFQQCAKDNNCQDYWYYYYNAEFFTGPAQCLAPCTSLAGFQDRRPDTGTCFNSFSFSAATAIVPAVTLILVASLALLLAF